MNGKHLIKQMWLSLYVYVKWYFFHIGKFQKRTSIEIVAEMQNFKNFESIKILKISKDEQLRKFISNTITAKYLSKTF